MTYNVCSPMNVELPLIVIEPLTACEARAVWIARILVLSQIISAVFLVWKSPSIMLVLGSGVNISKRHERCREVHIIVGKPQISFLILFAGNRLQALPLLCG